MRIASLGSGSKGNATVIAAAGSSLLVDCGFSLVEIQRRAAQLSVDLETLDAILVTHEHSDHCSGVAGLANRFDVPVYLTHGTAASGRLSSCRQLRRFDADSNFRVGEIEVHAIPVPHDAREPVQYCFRHGELSIGVLTDLGSVSPFVQRAYAACDLLLLEFNHDRAMLRDGPYPAALKRRVAGDWGHLSNTQAVEFLASLDHERLQHLIVAHTSEQNNCRERIASLLAEKLPALASRLVWAEQERGFPWLPVEPATESAPGRESEPETRQQSLPQEDCASPLASPVGIRAY